MAQFDWLAASFAGTTFTVFDTETTGLEAKTNRVVEAGAIRFDSRGIIARFNVLINPGVSMPPEVTRINGITTAMLSGQPAPETVYPDFLRFIGDTVLIAHNAPFDICFINEELARLGKSTLRNRVIDTRIFAKEMFPGLPNYKLQDLALRFGINAIDAHRAEDDARVCMELFLTCLAELRKKIPAVPGSPADTVLPTAASPAAAVTNTVDTARAESMELFEEDMEEEEFLDGEPDL